MIEFLLLVSFLLHIIALIAIFHLLKKIKQSEKESSRDLIDLFDSYLEEIREENKQLEDKLKAIERPKQTKNGIPNEANALQAPEKNVAAGESGQIFPDNEAVDTVETSLTAKILQLHDQGLSHELIAKQLNCGKTEAQLIIQLYGNE